MPYSKFKFFLLTFLFTTFTLNAGNMYSLTGIKKIYPLVEISGKKIPAHYKQDIYEELNSSMNSLNIDTKGFDQRAVAILINEIYVEELLLINIQLIVGEQVKRIDDGKTTFALTYQNQARFVLKEKEELEEQMEDTIDELLSKFSDQYKEDNTVIKKVKINEENFIEELKYETNYDKAIAKANKENKNVLFVLVANYCPWCRKFEHRVLMKEDVNKAIHKKYVPLIMNREKGGFPKEFAKEMTPIVHFIDSKSGKSYHNVVGYNNRADFLYLLKSDK